MEIIKWLNRLHHQHDAEAALDIVRSKLSLRVARDGDLAILNYHQIDSPKHDPMARECRGLTIDVPTATVVARGFNRFFNAGEWPSEEGKFRWDNFSAESKEDGSLMLLYHHDGRWRVNTRGSFAQQEIVDGCGVTWEQGFYRALGDCVDIDVLRTNYTYVFEFCSPWNQVVVHHAKPTLFLLTAVHTESGAELSEFVLDNVAVRLGVRRPERFWFDGLASVVRFVNDHTGQFEGCVLRDCNGYRLKVKNKAYVALHHLKDNGNVFAEKNLLRVLLRGEHDEVLSAFPDEAGPALVKASAKMHEAIGRMNMAWEVGKRKASQKEFAIWVNEHGGPLRSLLFTARKEGVAPAELLRREEDIVVKLLT